MASEVSNPPVPVDLRIQQGADFDFDLGYYEDDEETLIPILSYEIVMGTREYPLPIGDYTTLVDGILQVRVPAAVSDLWLPFGWGIWELTITTAEETRKLVAGAATMEREARWA